MKILLAVPSKDRVETFKKYTHRWLCLLPFQWKLFVEPQDEVKYLKFKSNTILLGENNKGLGYSKVAILDYAKKNNYDLIFKIDDDIRCFTNFRAKTNPEQCAELLKKLIPQFIETFETHKTISAISFPYSFELYDREGYTTTKRIQTAYIVRTEDFYVNMNISVFEDFAAGLHILSKAQKILKFGLSGIDCGVKVGAGTGGHQHFDRKAQALKEIPLLRNIYPPLGFRKVDKPWEIEPDLSSVKL